MILITNSAFMTDVFVVCIIKKFTCFIKFLKRQGGVTVDLELEKIPLVDHHCHTIIDNRQSKNIETFIRSTTEAGEGYSLSDITETITFQYMIKYLNQTTESNCQTVKDIEKLLSQLDYNQHVASIFKDNNYKKLFIDTGFHPHHNMSLKTMSGVTNTEISPVLRLEKLAEIHKEENISFSVWWESIIEDVSNARDRGYIAAKSVIAYRSGLDIYPVSFEDAKAAFKEWNETKLQDSKLLNFLIWELTPILMKQDLPLQFHVGYGDPDTDLLKGNPLLLKSYIEKFTPDGLKITLLHTYPYHREAGFLASVYQGVYFDLSLIIPLGAFGAERIMAEALELTSMNRFLFASDAHTRPEFYGHSAQLFRDSLNKVLNEVYKNNVISTEKAYQWAENILYLNASNLYLKQ